MTPLFQQINMANGLELLIHDHTRRYFGDYCHVKLEIRCSVALSETVDTAQVDTEEVRKLLGDAVVYRRFLEKMGVPTGEVEIVQKQLVADFFANSLAYIESTAFPKKLVAAEFRRAQKRMPRAKL